MVDRVDEVFKNRLLGENKYTKVVDEKNPIKLLDAIRDVCYKADVGINDMDNKMLTTKKFLNLERLGKQFAAAWSKVVEANFDAVIKKNRVFWNGVNTHLKLLEEEGKSLIEYFKMDPKDRKKWDKKVCEMQIAYQMRMGWNNERLNNELKSCFVASGRNDDLIFPQMITDVICTLDTTKEYAPDHRKLQDGMRDGRNNSQQRHQITIKKTPPMKVKKKMMEQMGYREDIRIPH